jgi:beta-galactosidase
LPEISRRTALAILATPLCAAPPASSPAPRARLSLAGPWRWKPEGESSWRSLTVPDAWPRDARANTAVYERDVAIPAEWQARRIALTADCVNSYAVVFADGVRAGELRYPAGELDLTPYCHPGQTVVLRLEVTAMPLKAVMLSYSDSANAKTIEGAVVRRGITGDIFLNAMPAGPRLDGLAVETSFRRREIAVRAETVALDPAAPYRYTARVYDGDRVVHTFTGDTPRLTSSWLAPKLWDLHTPQHQYRTTVTLADASGTELDTTLPVPFGFREFWIDGRDFYLNGTRLHLSATPLDNAQSVATAGYEATRATLRHFKTIGVNFVYTHNYGCEPGTHFSFEEVLRAADDEGVLVAFSQPHFGQYDWTAADARNGYAQHAAFYVRVARNHPSVVFYSTSHNGAGYSEDMNPDLLDGVHEPRDQWSARGAQRARRAEALIRQLDPSRIVYHHSGGNLGSMHTVNFYGNWIPPQEMDDWFGHWAAEGVKPLFPCEYSVPFLWDWGMYRGWYQGKREFGSAVVPWEFHVAEWDAQFLGDRAYRITEPERVNLRWEAAQFRQGRVWHRWDYPNNLGTPVFADRLEILAAQVEQNWHAFRTWGLSANGVPWDIGNYWDKEEPTPVVRALQRCNLPLLAYIAGKAAAVTSKDHVFAPGEAIEKQLVVINDTREPVTADVEFCGAGLHACAGPPGPAGAGLEAGRRPGGLPHRITLPPGTQQRLPIHFRAPSTGRHELKATVTFSTGAVQEDTFAIDILPPVPGPRASGILTIPKGALTLDGPAPDLTRVRDGLKVVVFEQSADVLEKRLGFRVAQYGLRRVFPRVPGHPLLAGLAEHHLHDWRGEATLLPPRLRYVPGAQFNNAPTVEWAGIPVTRVWRAGNRGNVASVLIEKPACGDFLPVLDGGYGLQYSPLLEYREGKGVVLFCQMDVSSRTESDPAAERLVHNIHSYLEAWQPAPRRPVAYRGDPAGRSYLAKAGVAISEAADTIAAFGVALPGIAVEEREYIGEHFDPFPLGSPFAGISPADVFNRDPRRAPLANGRPLAASPDGRAVFAALAPWNFDYGAGRMNCKRTFRNFARMTARLFGNLGAPMRTPLLDRFSAPVAAADRRWLDGLYMDTPEEWDDPYRFFRW